MLDSLIRDNRIEHLDPSEIRTDGGTQMRAMYDRDTLEEYAQAMLAGDQFPPITVFYDGSDHWLGDGFHRLAAWQEVMDDTIEAEIHAGTRRDAILYAAAANANHGLRRSNKDKRRSVITLLQDDEWAQWSDREIARRCKVSNRFVSNLRDELGSSQTERRYTRNGEERTMDVSGIGSSRPASPTVNGSQLNEEQALTEPAQEIHVQPAAEAPQPTTTASTVNGSQLNGHHEPPAAPPRSGKTITLEISVEAANSIHDQLIAPAPGTFAGIYTGFLIELRAALHQALAPQQTPEEPPAAQPDFDDSQTTEWEPEWSIDDQKEYRAIEASGAWFSDDITRPLVALRMIENEEDKDLRAILWKRYNQLKAETDGGQS